MDRKIAVIFVFVLLFFPLVLDSAWMMVTTTFIIFTCVALSQDIILGRTGVFNMGHALFFGLGAYTTAVLNVVFEVPIIYTLVPSVLMGVVCAYFLIRPIVHIRGDYLLVSTIGFNVIFLQLLENDIFGITGGPNGIFGIDLVRVFGYELESQKQIFYLALFILCLVLLLCANLDRTKIGRAMFFINQDEIAAKSMGIDVSHVKLYAFMLGGAIACVAGSLFVIQYGAVSPSAFSVTQSIMFFTIVLVGGSGSLAGVLVGTFVMVVLPEAFREFEQARYLIFGVAMILTMILRPRGILPRKFGDIPAFLKKESE